MKLMTTVILAATLFSVGAVALATPEEDRQAFRAYFEQRFPQVEIDDYINGAYALDAAAREQWEAMEEFPPYELALDEGEALFHTPFANGRTYADCFDNGGIGIRQTYPRFDPASGQVVTLELAINNCRESHGEAPLAYEKGEIAALSAYMAYTSRDRRFVIEIPHDPQALEAYEAGKRFYYTRRGQFDLACHHCHLTSAGMLLRGDRLSPALGHPAPFPEYRSSWGEMGTLHRFLGICNDRVRARPFAAQSEEFRNLEYFLTYMSNGLKVNGPGSRK